MNLLSRLLTLFSIFFSALIFKSDLPAVEATHGNVKVTARVCEFESKLQLSEIEPIARLIPAKAPAFGPHPPDSPPLLPGMTAHPIRCHVAEAVKSFRVLESDFGARRHPEVSRTVPIGREIAFTIPFATEKLDMRVLTALACRIQDEVALLISFPDSSRPVNPLMEVRSSRYSPKDQSCILCRTEITDGGFHHTLILLEETRYGVAGQDPVTRVRDKLQRWIVPETHLEPVTTLQLIEWLVQMSRKLDKQPGRSPGQGLNLVWISEPPQTAGPAKTPHAFYEQTMRKLLFHSVEFSSLDLAIEPHALVFRMQASHTECSPGQLESHRFRVKPQMLERFPDDAAMNTAAESSNIPVYEQGGFTLDRERLILTCRQIPEHFNRSEKWLRDQNLLDETPLPAPKLPASLVRAGKIILPQLELRRATLSEAVKAIQQAAMAAGPMAEDLKIVIEPGTQEETRITMFTHAIPASEALRYCAELSYYRIEAGDFNITLHPLTQP